MTTAEFRELFQMLLAGWPAQRQRMSPEDIRGMTSLYTAGLVDLDAGVVADAIARLVRTSEWLPTVAAIRKAAGVIIHGDQATGAEAWGDVVQMIRTKGSHRTPGIDFQFSDPITDRVVAALNWLELCQSDNAVADRARFIDCYEQIANNERTNAQASAGGASSMLAAMPDLKSIAAPEPRRVLLPPGERSKLLRDVLREINDDLGLEVFRVEPIEVE